MAATDDYALYQTPPDGPCRHAAAVTPSDSVDLTNVSRYLVATVAGAITVITAGGETTAIQAAVGIPLPVAASRVKATGTTATGIVALW